MSQALKCYKVFSAADMFDFSKLQPIMAWSHFAASVATRNPRFPYRIASFWEQTMKELKEKTRVRILRSGLVRWLVPVVGKHCCTCSIALLVLQVLFTKIVNVTGSPAVIKEDNTVDLELFQSTIMVHTRINDYPMVHFPLMWEVNAWRHVICGEVRAFYGHPEEGEAGVEVAVVRGLPVLLLRRERRLSFAPLPSPSLLWTLSLPWVTP